MTESVLSMVENEISGIIVDLCLRIHKALGPGLLESVYEEVLCYELSKAKLPYVRQQVIPVVYEGIKLELGFRSDVIVMGKVLVELKSVESIAPVHKKITLTYLRLTNLKVGLLVNFNEALMKDGLHRIVNGL